MAASKTMMSLKLLSLTQVKAQEIWDDEIELRVSADGKQAHAVSRTFTSPDPPVWTFMSTWGLVFNFFDTIQVALWELDPAFDDPIGKVRFPGDGASALVLGGTKGAKTIEIQGDGCCYRLSYELDASPTQLTAPPLPVGTPADQVAKANTWFFSKELARERSRKAKMFIDQWSGQVKRTAWVGLCTSFGEAGLLSRFVTDLKARVTADKVTGFPIGTLEVKQQYLNVCGLAATEVLLIANDPLRFAYLMAEIYEFGRISIQGGIEKATKGALGMAYCTQADAIEILAGTGKGAGNGDVSTVEWMFALTLACWLTDVGSATDVIGGNGGAVMPTETQELMRRVLLCRKVWHEGTSVTSGFSTMILENALCKLNDGKYEFGMLACDGTMVKWGDHFRNAFVSWDAGDVAMLAGLGGGTGPTLFVEAPTLGIADNKPTELHAGSYLPASDPESISDEDWNHIVVVLPYVYQTGGRRYVNLGTLALPQSVAMKPGPSNMLNQEPGSGGAANVAVWIFCCITWGTMRWVAVDDAAISAWFGAMTLGRR